MIYIVPYKQQSGLQNNQQWIGKHPTYNYIKSKQINEKK